MECQRTSKYTAKMPNEMGNILYSSVFATYQLLRVMYFAQKKKTIYKCFCPKRDGHYLLLTFFFFLRKPWPQFTITSSFTVLPSLRLLCAYSF